MKSLVPGLAALVLLAGCSADWDQERAPATRGGNANPPAADVVPVSVPPHVSARAFASLPDRGELLAYDADSEPRRRGAYTSHAVAISEAHAFAAAHPGGEMTLIAPDGEQLRVAYERHVEHPEGDWTWIGRTADGRDAVVTFGPDAVFGMVPRSGAPDLRLTTQGGRAWMVDTDPAMEAFAASRIRGLSDTDVLVPPATVATAAAAAHRGSPLTGMAGPVAERANETGAGTYVDLVVGFSSGLATQLGGDSQARTRISYLLDLTNQSLANSEIAPRLRVVRSMRVAYGDNTSNESALEQLTGFSAATQSAVPVPAALRPLRTARETYGGDLVVLLRAFRTPQNEGCGIAWMIGGEGGDYTVDAEAFGYSVVSDGEDRDEDENVNYYCLDTSFGHEIGHNFGQAHTEDGADTAGVHPYSYGYRESTNTGFFTVMAYALPDGDQSGILHFANPQVRYSGRVTGVANRSDNARSMRETMQVAAEFRATEIPLPGRRTRQDVNGDGRSDLLWWRPGGTFVHWWMNGSNTLLGRSFAVPSGWTAIGGGDFNGDGRNDVVWQAANGNVYIWLNSNGNAYGVAQPIGNRSGWTLVGTRDVDGNGTADLQWFRPGTFVHWRMSGATVTVGRSFTVPANWTVIGTGDLNGDGRSDVVLRAPGGGIHYWRNTNGNAYAPAESIGNRQGWELRGVGDIDGDRRDDLVWWRSGTLVHWQMNGATPVRGRSFPVNTTWTPSGVADFNGDGRGDIVWRASNGNVYLWLNTNGNAYGPAQLVGNRSGWNIVPM